MDLNPQGHFQTFSRMRVPVARDEIVLEDAVFGEDTALFQEMRQGYLDALPIAAAVVALSNGKLRIHSANILWKHLHQKREADHDHILEGIGCTEEIIGFLKGETAASQIG